MNEIKHIKSVEDVQKILDLMRTIDCVSLNKVVITDAQGKNPIEMGDLIEDVSPGPQEILEQQDVKNRLLYYVNKLPARQQKIIVLRFGLDDGKPKTLEEVGKMYNVTRERIRQIEMAALKRLRWLITVKGKCKTIENF